MQDIKELLVALKPIIDAVEVNDSDTLYRPTPDHAVMWEATGSWSVPVKVTFGDLRAIAKKAKELDA